VDEVLAVGDAEFQKKCLGKMKEVSKGEGRTVLFVSHNMTAILNLCQKSLYLQNGLLLNFDNTQNVVADYLLKESKNKVFQKHLDANKRIQLIEAEIINVDSKKVNLSISIFSKEYANASIDIRLKDGLTMPFGFYSFGALNPEHLLKVKQGYNIYLFSINTRQFAVGSYWISIDITNPAVEYYDRSEDILFFQVINERGDIDRKQLQQSWNYGSFILPIYLNP
jgi:lipopolysaccharide transport system ATP-binding protein